MGFNLEKETVNIAARLGACFEDTLMMRKMDQTDKYAEPIFVFKKCYLPEGNIRDEVRPVSTESSVEPVVEKNSKDLPQTWDKDAFTSLLKEIPCDLLDCQKAPNISKSSKRK